MKFNLSKEKVDNLKEYVIKFLKRDEKLFYQEFWALKNVSFEVQTGDKLGIVGLNGAGKSTLLKLISGVMKPTEGLLETEGRISPLLELGAGFDQNYTGRENIFLNGALLGYSKRFLESKFDEIVEFSELSDFIDVPLKNYSSGMKMRLGFSIATVVEPEILILDEVLSVGDAKFQEKCEKRMQSFLDKDVTVLFVSHTVQQVRDLCNKAIWLEKGKLIMQGTADEVCDAYWASIHPDKINEKIDVKKEKIKSQYATKEFNRPQVANELNLQVNEGEILGILGVNNPDDTKSVHPIIRFLGSSIGRIDNIELKQFNSKYVGICPQELVIWNNLTCIENLSLMGKLFKVPKNVLKQRVDRLLHDLFLIDEVDTVASNLPIGMKRRLNLALALVHEPEILVINEPSDGLDQQSRIIIWNFIESLHDLDGKTIIITTHHADEVDNLSDRVAIVNDGQILGLDTPLNLKKDVVNGDLVEIILSNQSRNQEVISSLKCVQDTLWIDEVNGSIHLRMSDVKGNLPSLITKIEEWNVHIKDLSVHQKTLGDVFTELTGISLEESK